MVPEKTNPPPLADGEAGIRNYSSAHNTTPPGSGGQGSRLDAAEVKQAANGKWPDILAALGVPDEYLRDRHGPCPGCGGTDRYRFTDTNKSGEPVGAYICSPNGNGCGTGDGFALLQMVHGYGFSESLKDVADYLGIGPESHSRRFSRPPAPTPKPAEKKRDTSAYAAELWLAAEFSDNAVAAHPYAKKKGITWAAGAARGIASGRVIGKRADCIIVPIRDLSSGRVAAVQCINADGAKQTFGSIKGHGLLLGNTLDKSLVWHVCEGWASAASIVFHHLKGNGVCAASFGKSNQATVAERLAEIYDPEVIRILKEVD